MDEKAAVDPVENIRRILRKYPDQPTWLLEGFSLFVNHRLEDPQLFVQMIKSWKALPALAIPAAASTKATP